jgi:hypothetical protein
VELPPRVAGDVRCAATAAQPVTRSRLSTALAAMITVTQHEQFVVVARTSASTFTARCSRNSSVCSTPTPCSAAWTTTAGTADGQGCCG